MKVLVLAENPRHDQYILKPVIERVFSDLGRSARVDVLHDPRLDSASRVLDSAILGDIVQENPMEDLFVLVVDRDCDREHNASKAAQRESDFAGKLLACVAIEEVEVWMLALHRDAILEKGGRVAWTEVRADCDPKERFAVPLLEQRGWSTGPGKGRKRAMRELGSSWRGLLDVCDEVRELKEKIDRWLCTTRRLPAP